MAVDPVRLCRSMDILVADKCVACQRESPTMVLDRGVTEMRGQWITDKQVKRAAEQVLRNLAAALDAGFSD
jgi:hypothetical protein